MPFSFKRLDIPDVVLIKPQVFSDERGFFMEIYKYGEFSSCGIKDHFVQDNHSKSFSKGVNRGLHFQKKPCEQAKLVRTISGSVLDVAVDIRRGSPTFGKWVSAILSAKNKSMLYIPVGFAHGFCVQEDDTEIVYRCSHEYSPEHDRGIIWSDPKIGISWLVNNPILSARDKNWPSLAEADIGFSYV